MVEAQTEDTDFPIDDKTHALYRSVRVIGRGLTGYVEEVLVEDTKSVYARKTVEVDSHDDRTEALKVFANEVKIIRSLTGHPHFVRVIAAYATERHFNLVLQPKADEGDLARFLDVYLNVKGKVSEFHRASSKATLERAFGCLASGLAFMHKNRIRHRDVKPKNILIHAGSVMWADFGYSRDSSLFEHSATKGPVDAQTKRYSAPEVLSWDERDSKADVYSLGCVFIEVFFAISKSKAALESGKYFSHEMDRFHTELAASECSAQLESLPKIICCMTLRPPTERLEADDLCCEILDKEAFSCSQCHLQVSSHRKARQDRLEIEAAANEQVSEKKADEQLQEVTASPTGGTSSNDPLATGDQATVKGSNLTMEKKDKQISAIADLKAKRPAQVGAASHASTGRLTTRAKSQKQRLSEEAYQGALAQYHHAYQLWVAQSSGRAQAYSQESHASQAQSPSSLSAYGSRRSQGYELPQPQYVDEYARAHDPGPAYQRHFQQDRSDHVSKRPQSFRAIELYDNEQNDGDDLAPESDSSDVSETEHRDLSMHRPYHPRSSLHDNQHISGAQRPESSYGTIQGRDPTRSDIQVQQSSGSIGAGGNSNNSGQTTWGWKMAAEAARAVMIGGTVEGIRRLTSGYPSPSPSPAKRVPLSSKRGPTVICEPSSTTHVDKRAATTEITAPFKTVRDLSASHDTMTAELDSGPKPRPKPKGSAAYIALTSSVTPYNSTGSHDPTPTTESSTRPTGESADSTKSTPHGNPWIWSEEYRMHYRMEKDNTGKLRFTTGSIDLT